MAYKATLDVKIGDQAEKKGILLREVKYDLFRNTEESGMPSAEVRGGKIKLTVESSNFKGFFEWMVDPNLVGSGSITFPQRTNSDASMKKIIFLRAHMVEYEECFNSINDQPLLETFTISANILELSGCPAKHDNKWAVLEDEPEDS